MTARVDAAMSGIVYGVQGDSVFYIAGQRIVRPPHVEVSQPIVDGSYVRVTGLLIAGELRATDIVVLGAGRPYILDGQIEAVDASSRTFRMLGLELFVNEWTQGRPLGSLPTGSVAVGHWYQVWAHRNGFVRAIYGQWICCVGKSGAESAWFSSVSPPSSFTIESAAKFTVQTPPSALFALGIRKGDGECYGYDPISSDEFWRRASEPQPADATSVFSWGRFEGGMLIADTVYVCYPEGL
jgi:hypothetical protein